MKVLARKELILSKQRRSIFLIEKSLDDFNIRNFFKHN